MNRAFIYALIIWGQMFIQSQSIAANNLENIAIKRVLVSKTQTFNGIVEAIQEATLASEVSGRVLEVNFDVDDVVKVGEILVKVYSKSQKANKRQVIAQLNIAKARLKEAKSNHQRISKLYKKKLVPKATFDKADADLQSASENVQAIRATMAKVNEGLSQTIITAPFSGIVTERHVEVGEVTAPGKALMSGFDPEKMRISIDIPQRLVDIVRKNKQVEIRLANQQTFKSKDFKIFPYANKYTGTIRVRVDVPAEITNLYPGMYVKAIFNLGKRKTILVPEKSIVYRGEVVGTYVISDKKIRFRYLRIGQKIGKKVEILSGLNAGEKIALDPMKAGIELKKQAGANVL